jgi:hypothetical protein
MQALKDMCTQSDQGAILQQMLQEDQYHLFRVRPAPSRKQARVVLWPEKGRRRILISKIANELLPQLHFRKTVKLVVLGRIALSHMPANMRYPGSARVKRIRDSRWVQQECIRKNSVRIIIAFLGQVVARHYETYEIRNHVFQILAQKTLTRQIVFPRSG